MFISLGRKELRIREHIAQTISAYAKQKEASCKTSARLNQTPEARQKRAEYMRGYRPNVLLMQSRKKLVIKEHTIKARKTLKAKEKACESQSSVMKQYRTNSKASCIQDLIYKFHNIVSRGPMYICNCCDQLWYRHSVNSAHKLRKPNPSVDKYLKQVLITQSGFVYHVGNI